MIYTNSFNIFHELQVFGQPDFQFMNQIYNELGSPLSSFSYILSVLNLHFSEKHKTLAKKSLILGSVHIENNPDLVHLEDLVAYYVYYLCLIVTDSLPFLVCTTPPSSSISPPSPSQNLLHFVTIFRQMMEVITNHPALMQ